MTDNKQGRKVIYLLANEKKNMGEADYAKAVFMAVRGNEIEGDTHIALKIPVEDNIVQANFNEITKSSTLLPINNAEYEKVASYDAAILDALGDEPVTVIGLGNSTIATMKAIQAALPQDTDVDFSYVTHMVHDAEDLKWLVENDADLFAPVQREELKALDAVAALDVNLQTLDAVPHTNTPEACEVEYRKFLQTENGQIVQAQMDANAPIAVSVINAGFDVNGTYEPYTEDEAFAHGFALGEGLDADTMLLAMHGGPRNVRDENECNQKTMDKYVEGYLAAQQAKGGNPVVVTEPFVRGCAYNAIKAGYSIAQAENCVAFISNAEGYGTMDGALNLIPQEKADRMIVGMFPFGSLYKDPSGQRQANVDKYNALGISVLSNDKDTLKISHVLSDRASRIQPRDAAAQILETKNVVKKHDGKLVYNFGALSM